MRPYALPRDRPDRTTFRDSERRCVAGVVFLLVATAFVAPALPQRMVWSGSPPFGGGYTGLFELKPGGDIDGDGIADVITTTGFASFAFPRVVLLRGVDGTCAWWLPTSGALFGVDSVGDVNGDLIDDVAIGRPSPGPNEVDVRSGLNGSLAYEIGSGLGA
jgi:hypothetical protein